MLSVLGPDATSMILKGMGELFIYNEAVIDQFLLLERLLMDTYQAIGQMTSYGVIVVYTCHKDNVLSLRKSCGRP